MSSTPQTAKRTITIPEGVLSSHASYSQAVVCGQLLFTSGQGAFDPRTGALTGDDLRTQANLTLENLLLVAAAAGARAEDAVRIGVHLAHLDDFAVFDEVYRQYFHEPYPTRVTVEAPLLAGMLVEVDGIFALPSDPKTDGSPAQ